MTSVLASRMNILLARTLEERELNPEAAWHTWSGDGMRIAFVDENGRISAVHVETMAVEELHLSFLSLRRRWRRQSRRWSTAKF